MRAKKNIGILTSSRADFGIYLPLLNEIQKNRELGLGIIAFGTHLSPYHGMTIDYIESQGFEVDYKINSMLLHDDENAISSSVSLTMMKFAEFWKTNGDTFDIVFCLGDRFEMFGAVYAGVPFGIKFAHIHGGETTLGAIDNTYRHAISLASHLHFVSTKEYKDRVWELTKSDNIYVSGSLSLHNLDNIELLSVSEMKEKFSIDFSEPTVLVTVHPETIESKWNKKYANVCVEVFKDISAKYQVVITMPNADTKGSLYRIKFMELEKSSKGKIVLVENFGTEGYFSAMKLSKFLIGNTSSGIIEAATFNKYVINLGDRQKGRGRSNNVIDCPFELEAILGAVDILESKGSTFIGENIYYREHGLEKIVELVRTF